MCSMSLTVVVSARCELGRNASGHLIRLQAGVPPDAGDHRDADVGKNVDGRAQRGERTDDKNDEGQNDESVRTPQCDADERDHAAVAPGSRSMASAMYGMKIPPAARLMSPRRAKRLRHSVEIQWFCNNSQTRCRRPV